MNKNLKQITYFFLIFNLMDSFLYASHINKAVICVPVADVATQELGTINNMSAEQLYNNIPCSIANMITPCYRATQLLFNTIIEVVKITDHEVCFKQYGHGRSENTFWTLKNNVKLLEDLSELLFVLPDESKLLESNSSSDENIIILITPVEIANVLYSAGTKFKKQNQSNISNKITCISVPDFETKTIQEVVIDEDQCIIFQNQNSTQTRALFLELLNLWSEIININNDKEAYPYLFGGRSLGYKAKIEDFTIVREKVNSKLHSGWYNKNKQHKTQMGSDCIGLIILAMRIANIDHEHFDIMNMPDYFTALKKGESLQEGDLIWFTGHVLVICNIDDNEIIQADGFGGGYGNIHILKLNKVLLDIDNYQDLLNIYYKYLEGQDISLKWKNIKGEVRWGSENIKHIKILKLLK